MNILKSLAILIGVLSLATFSTHAVFTSQASVVGNEFSTGTFPTPTPDKVDICHTTSGKAPYQLINININALPAHLAHGDIYPVPPGGCPTSVISGASVELSPTPTPSLSPTPTPTPSESLSPTETPSPVLTE